MNLGILINQIKQNLLITASEIVGLVAANIPFTPVGTLTATNVQAMGAELDSDITALAASLKGGAFVDVAAGGTGGLLRADGDGSGLTGFTKVLKEHYEEYSTQVSGSNGVFSNSATPPLISEGSAYTSVSFTPTRSDSKIRVLLIGCVGNNTANSISELAVFNGNTYVARSGFCPVVITGQVANAVLIGQFDSVDTTAKTINIRVGGSNTYYGGSRSSDANPAFPLKILIQEVI